MPLPIIIIFEDHTELASKKVLANSLTILKALGYDTLCLESTQNDYDEAVESLERYFKILASIKNEIAPYLKRLQIKYADLKKMPMHKLLAFSENYLSTKNFTYIANAIKNEDAAQEQLRCINMAGQLGFTIEGIDNGVGNQIHHADLNLPEQNSLIEASNSTREQYLSEQLLYLMTQGRGIVFVCGRLHYHGLMQKLNDLELSGVLPFVLFEDEQQMQDFSSENAYLLDGKKSEDVFINHFMHEIENYLENSAKPLEEHHRSQQLESQLGVRLYPKVWPSFFVDAEIDTSTLDVSHIQSIQQKLSDLKIPFRSDLFKHKIAIGPLNVNPENYAPKSK